MTDGRIGNNLSKHRAATKNYSPGKAIANSGLLDSEAVDRILLRHGDENTRIAQRVQLDAVINHLLSVQMMHEHFVAKDIPKLARNRAVELDWI